MKKKILSIVLCLCLVLGMLPMAARAAGTYIVTFSANGRGTAPAAQTVADGENAAEPAAPTAVGYAFGGWYTDAGCTAAYNFSAAVAGDLTLYARWTAYSYSVRFALDAGGTLSGAAEQTVAYGGRAASACTVRPDSGYQLAGWRYDYTAADGSQQIGVAAGDTGYASVAVLGDVVFRAVLCRTPFVLAAASNGYVSLASDAAGAADPAVGKTVSDVTENISGSDLPVSAGVRFAPQGENYALASITIRDFQSPVHALTLTGDSDTAASKQLKSGTYSFSTAGSAVQVTVDLAAGTITTDKTIGASIAFDIAYVKIQTSCTVKYYKQNIDRSGYDEAAADRQTEPAAAGAKITFQPRSCAGFRYEAAKTTYADSAHENPQTDALTAKFDGTSVVSLYYDRISSFLSFDVNGRGAAPDAQQLVYGAKASEPAAPTAGGYTFGGWYKEDTCANQWNFASDTVTAATTLYAKWTANGGGTPSGSNTFVPPEAEPHGYLLRIQIDTGIDNVPTEITAADPTLSTPAAVESRLKVGIDRVLGTTGSVTVKDFDLSLWVSQDAGATWTRATAENFPAGGITVVIPWQELGLTYEQAQHTSFSVTHMFAASVNGHTPGTTESPAWTITESGLQFTLNGLSPVAVGYKSLPLVTFDANGGSCGTAGAYTAQSGKLASLPVPTRSGYTFAGWYTLEKGGYEITANAVITANTTVYAHWTANSAAAVPAPNTGDNSGTVLWIILMLTGMYGLAAIVVWCRRKGS